MANTKHFYIGTCSICKKTGVVYSLTYVHRKRDGGSAQHDSDVCCKCVPYRPGQAMYS